MSISCILCTLIFNKHHFFGPRVWCGDACKCPPLCNTGDALKIKLLTLFFHKNIFDSFPSPFSYVLGLVKLFLKIYYLKQIWTPSQMTPNFVKCFFCPFKSFLPPRVPSFHKLKIKNIDIQSVFFLVGSFCFLNSSRNFYRILDSWHVLESWKVSNFFAKDQL